MDVFVSALALTLTAPVMIGIGLAILTEDRGPALFRQNRRGRNGATFRIIKFRTMRSGAADLRLPDGSTYNGVDDPRVTRVGAFLRRWSLDELPQLLNVLVGEMSLVGPRPDLPDHSRLDIPEDAIRLKVRPGITGLAQVRGRNSILLNDRRRLDRWYVRHWGLRLDLWILLRTIPAAVSGDGVLVGAAESDVSTSGAGAKGKAV